MKPLISIITVVRNCESHIEQTIKSVIDQTYKPIEYIIIDGNSTDKTVDIIKKYEGKLSHWISESDKGIYDAMNKGIALSSGEWINFLNAGDYFYSKQTLDTIFSTDLSFFDVIYGDSVIVYDNFFQQKKAGPFNKLWTGMIFSHQSMFIKSNLQKQNPYNIHNLIGADFEMIYGLYHYHYAFNYLQLPISCIRTGGVSDINRMECVKTNYKTVKKYRSDFQTILFYVFFAGNQLLKLFFKKILSKKIQDMIILSRA